jgi:ERCC4-type nuclease
LQFERPCLLIETEKPSDPDVQISFAGGFVEQHGGIHRTKYVDTVLAQLSQSKFQVLYSASQAESAQILAALASKEARKGYSLPFPLRLLNHKVYCHC